MFSNVLIIFFLSFWICRKQIHYVPIFSVIRLCFQMDLPGRSFPRRSPVPILILSFPFRWHPLCQSIHRILLHLSRIPWTCIDVSLSCNSPLHTILQVQLGTKSIVSMVVLFPAIVAGILGRSALRTWTARLDFGKSCFEIIVSVGSYSRVWLFLVRVVERIVTW